MVFDPTDKDDMIYWAWGILANVGMDLSLGWYSQSPEWVDAAKAWRDSYFEHHLGIKESEG